MKIETRDRLRIFYKKGGKRTHSAKINETTDTNMGRPKYIDLREE
nr:hypothetical protein [Mycoplasmopsis bovis]